jgi:hypothetical protein
MAIFKLLFGFLKIPSIEAVEKAIENANTAAKSDFLEVLKKFKRQGVLPTKIGANYAIIYGHLEKVKWLLKNEIYPSQKAIEKAERLNQEDVVILFQPKY